MNSPQESTSRWQTIKKLFIFQCKLGLDALRDLILSPISVICFFLDLVFTSPKGQGYFDRLMYLGRNTDRWINLFGQHGKETQSPSLPDPANLTAEDPTNRANVDHWFEKIETLLDEQQHQGGLSKQAKSTIDQYLSLIAAKTQAEGNTEGK